VKSHPRYPWRYFLPLPSFTNFVIVIFTVSMKLVVIRVTIREKRANSGQVLARTFNMLFVNSARALFTLAVISASTPVFVALIIPLSLVYYWVQRYYLRTSRELKRLDSVSRSPIYAHFQESLGGVTTIRAYRQQQRFAMENEWRVDANLRAYFPSINANR
jgi:ATP-binding cassette subfamily C (CFTR/MRP) protein 1